MERENALEKKSEENENETRGTLGTSDENKKVNMRVEEYEKGKCAGKEE